RVTAQAEASARDDPADIAQLKTRSNSGAMVPIGSVATFSDKTGPYRVTRYNLFPAVEVDGETAPGTSTGQAMGIMENLAAQLPSGFSTEWAGIAFQQVPAGSARQYCHPDLRAVVGVRLPGACRSVREPVPAPGDHPDRADDAAGGD